MPITRTLTPSMTGRVKFATSTAPLPPLADLVSNSTPPGQITREWVSLVVDQLAREIGLPVFYNPLWINLEGRCAAYPHIRRHGSHLSTS